MPDALLLIAGGTTLFDYRAELERFAERADQLGVTEHVWRLGALDSEELERLFRAADVFAFPSVKEGFGLVALEAIAAGLPLVASDLDVFRGFLHRRRVARCSRRSATPTRSPHALARVRHDKALRTRLRAGGRAVVAQHTWDASAELARARLRAHRGRAMEVTATFHGGFSATVDRARSHGRGRRAGDVRRRRRRASCRPSCCSAASRAASRSRSATPPASATSTCRTCASTVTAHRPGTELRYDRVVVSASADVEHEMLADFVDKAKRFCWVSNTFASPPEIEYRATEVV